MKYDRGDLAFLPIRPNDDFTKRLAKHFGIEDPDELVKNICYANGEYCPTITDRLQQTESSRRLAGRRACIVYSYTQTELKNSEAAFARILLLADAAYRAGAIEVYLIMAEHLFDRQDLDPCVKYNEVEYDRFSEGRKRKIEKMQGQPFSLKVAVKHFYEAGIKKVLTLDKHSIATDFVYDSVYSCSPGQVLYNLDPVPLFVSYLKSLNLDLGEEGENLILVAPDRGAKKAILEFYELLGLKEVALVFCNKYRTSPNDPTKVEAAVEETQRLKGVEDKIIVALDDKGDTLGTLQKTLVQGLTGDGKPKQIHAMLSHMIFSTKVAYELIADNKLNVHGSNSHPNMIFKKDEPGVENITVLDFTPYFAWALIDHVIPGEPLPNARKEDIEQYGEFFEIAKKGNIVDFK